MFSLWLLVWMGAFPKYDMTSKHIKNRAETSYPTQSLDKDGESPREGHDADKHHTRICLAYGMPPVRKVKLKRNSVGNVYRYRIRKIAECTQELDW